MLKEDKCLKEEANKSEERRREEKVGGQRVLTIKAKSKL